MPWKHWSAERLGLILAILAALGFSFKAIFVKLAYAVPQAVPVDSVTLLCLRMAFSVPVFAWVGWRASRNLAPLTRRDWLLVIALGLLGYYGASILDFIGLQYITASLERLILFTYPTLTILIGVLFTGKRASRREMGALLLSYAGIGLAFAHDLHIAGDTHAVLIGAGFVFGSAVSYAFYQAGSEPAIRRLGAARFTALAMLVSTVATLAHFIVSQPAGSLVQPAPVYLHALGMAIFSTVLPVFMTSAAIRRIGAAQTALVGTLGPILTIFFGCWLLDEPLSWPQMAGAALVLAGVLLISKRGAPAVRQAKEGSTSPASVESTVRPT
ncbi:DMT family transporter [Acidovorax sp. sif1233]|uniref:DMT family transporter n=1 Tax=Acidovorax sp. sif1233 TaxID=2854792 RepID=UPI001C443625|nr:DMT family transporter [Acidovorax sp. sif1233]MBV7454925.1 DMT family transporter [Acidovorax sp. sif1233]